MDNMRNNRFGLPTSLSVGHALLVNFCKKDRFAKVDLQITLIPQESK
ncbi:hypothetical protein GI584_08015 [Gracilibacillus salitolerans]|uniref:Uncharacterized protein n=1 Tax=Gracilibacillus salitolerans TaxID=2663022 RepID=A0A5Q2TIM3_9BACI|nr:hypothetical protein GI584_08015 [Gracilibacillus salitolerans]